MNATKKAPGAAKATETATAAMNAGKETLESAVKVGVEAASKNYEQAVTATKEQVEAAVKAGEDFFKGFEGVTAFGKDNLNAFMATSTLLAEGMRDLNKAWFDLAQDSLERNTVATKAVLECKSVNDLADVQNDLMKKNIDKAVAEGRKISDMSMKLAEEASAPLNSRVAAAMEKVTKPLAA